MGKSDTRVCGTRWCPQCTVSKQLLTSRFYHSHYAAFIQHCNQQKCKNASCNSRNQKWNYIDEDPGRSAKGIGILPASGSYNPFRKAYLDDPAFADDCRSLLTLMMSECSREFEQLPILLHAEILRNVLYSGVWSRYTAVTSERLAGKNTHNAADTADGNSTAGRTTNDNPHPDTDNSTTGDQEQ